MRDQDKTKEQLLNELVGLRQQVAQLQAADTDRKRVEQALRNSQEDLQTVFDSVKDGIALIDTTGKVTRVNKRIIEIGGYAEEEIIGKRLKLLKMFSPNSLAKLLFNFANLVSGQEVPPFDIQVHTKAGEKKDLELRGSLLRRNGKAVGMVGVMRDITERTQAEQALAKERDLLQALMNNIPDMIYFKDTASRFTRINRAQAQVLGVSDPREAIGKTDFDFFAPEHARDAYADEQEIVKSGQPLMDKVERIRRANGQFRWVSATKVPIIDEEGQVVGTVGISRDITERKQAQEEIERRNRELAALNAIITAMMRGALNLDEVLQRTADGVVKGLGCNTGLILLLDEKEGVFKGGAISTKANILERLSALIGSPLLQIKIPARIDVSEAMSNVLNGRITIKHDFYELVEPFLSRQVCSAMQRLLDSKSFFAVPLLAKGKTVGAIVASTPERLSEADAEKLMTFANQAAIAIENARLYEAEHRRSSELEALHQASLHLTSTLELQPILEAILDHALKLISADDAHVFLYDGERLTFGAALWEDRLQQRPYSELRQHGLTYTVARSGERIVIPDVGNHALFQDYPWGGAIIGLPLRIGERTVGVMNVAFEKPHMFDESELRVLGLLADQAAIAIQNARLYAEAQQRALEQETLREAALALTTALDRNRVIERILAQLQQVVPFDSASVLLLRGDQMQIVGGRGFPNLPDLLGVTFPADGDNPNREVMRTLSPLILRDAPALYEAFTQEPFAAMGIRSWLGVPMLIGDRPVGMITLDKCEPEFYTQEHARLAEAFAAQAAVAIENARLFEEEKRRSTQLALVNEVGEKAASILDSDRLMQEVTRSIQESFNYYNVALLLLDKERREVILQAIAGGFEHVASGEYRQSIDKGIVGFVARTGRPWLASNVSEDPYYIKGLSDHVLTQSELCVPIKLGENALGVLLVQSIHPNDFDQADVVAMEAVADQVAIAIENTRLFEEIKERRMYLEAVLGAAPDAIVTLDAQGCIAEWNPGAERLFGYSREEAIGQNIDHLITKPNVLEEAVGFTQAIMAGREVPPLETVRHRKDGSPVDVIMAGSPIKAKDGLTGTVAVYTDITARVRMEETLRTLALIDDLTNLYNRRGFVTLGQQQLKVANRTNRRMVLLFADFDGLKEINDAYGHPEGDRALIEVANILRETFRESDIIARIGGDEFVVLAIETSAPPTEVFATRFQERLKIRNTMRGSRYELSLSVGLAHYDPEFPCSIDDLLAQADKAMYAEKRGDTPA